MIPRDLRPCYMHAAILKFVLTITISITGWCLNLCRAQPFQYDTVFVYFDFDRSELLEPGKKTIDSILSRVIQTSYLKGITLAGHCDSVGDHRYNDSLSYARVATLRQYLYTKGANDRLIQEISGWGKRQPLVENDSEANRSINRRVEVVFKSVPNPAFRKKESPTPAPEPPPPIAKTPPPQQPEPRPQPVSIKEFIRDPNRKVGDSMILKNLHFIGGRHYPINASFPVLEELLIVMRENPTLRIAIEGHICCEKNNIDAVDIDTGTRDLSIQRAKFVYEYLRGYGIGGHRMEYRGYGSGRKLYEQEENGEQQQANRRVEIKIIDK